MEGFFHVESTLRQREQKKEVCLILLFIHSCLPLEEESHIPSHFPIDGLLDQSLVGTQRPHKEQEWELKLGLCFWATLSPWERTSNYPWTVQVTASHRGAHRSWRVEIAIGSPSPFQPPPSTPAPIRPHTHHSSTAGFPNFGQRNGKNNQNYEKK